MSSYNYGSGRSSLLSSFNERAGPRADARKYHHTVKPLARIPHYTQVSELYPMQAHADIPGDFRYRPTTDITMPGHHVSLAASPLGGGGGGIAIPVVHLGSSSMSSVATASPGYFSNRPTSVSASPGGMRGGSMATGGVGVGGGVLRKTSLPNPATDPEAEVDALTSVLMQKMETPRSGGVMSPHETSTGGTSSPVGGIRRSSAGTIGGVSVPSRMTRLQQQQQQQQRIGSPANLIGLSSSNGGGNNGGGGGSGSPITAMSPRTASPSNSSHSSGGGGSTDLSSFTQNSCYRCRRPLVPPEGSTLGGSASPPVVTLTGALAVRLHESCFTCYLCRTKLNPQGYYHSLHRLLCPTCVRDGAVESCENCRRPIGDRIVRALGTPYHPGCFVCSICQTHLDSKPFTVDVHGRPLCLEDFHKRYAPRCAICSRPIVPESGSHESRRVVAGNSNYHLNCYGVHAAASGAADSTSSTPTPTLTAA